MKRVTIITSLVILGLLMISLIIAASDVNISSNSITKAKKDPHASVLGMPMLVRVDSVNSSSFNATFLDLEETKPLINNLVIAPYDKKHYKAYSELKAMGSITFTVNDKGRNTSQLKKLDITQLKSGQIVGVMIFYPELRVMMKNNTKALETVAIINADSAYAAWRLSKIN